MAKKIDTDARIEKVRLQEQGSNPSAADAGYGYLYIKDGGKLFLMTDDGQAIGHFITGSSAVNPNHAYFTYLAAQLEPLAIEKAQTGAFTYAVPSGTTKIALATYWTSVDSVSRWEVRDPRFPVPLNGVTVTGLDSSSIGVFIDPTLPAYTDARQTYYDRLQSIYQTKPLVLNITATNSNYTFLPGAYGSIITSITIFDLTWLVGRLNGATTNNWNMTNEIGDTGASDYQRIGQGGFFPVCKKIVSRIGSGAERTGGVGKGSITYFNCPSTWGKVADSTSYTFRDDFMTLPLNTATKWTRTQSTAGNMEIQSTAGVANWCKIVGNSSWGANTITTQTSVARASGTSLQMDVFPSDSGAMYGWWDGAGTSYTDLAHAISFAGSSTIHVWEAGVDRGVVGTTYTAGSIYRIRLTLDVAGANTCKYEIQGTPEYPAIGGATWTDITPGTTSNSVTPLYGGIVAFSGTQYINDVKIY